MGIRPLAVTSEHSSGKKLRIRPVPGSIPHETEN